MICNLSHSQKDCLKPVKENLEILNTLMRYAHTLLYRIQTNKFVVAFTFNEQMLISLPQSPKAVMRVLS